MGEAKGTSLEPLESFAVQTDVLIRKPTDPPVKMLASMSSSTRSACCRQRCVTLGRSAGSAGAAEARRWRNRAALCSKMTS